MITPIFAFFYFLGFLVCLRANEIGFEAFDKTPSNRGGWALRKNWQYRFMRRLGLFAAALIALFWPIVFGAALVHFWYQSKKKEPDPSRFRHCQDSALDFCLTAGAPRYLAPCLGAAPFCYGPVGTSDGFIVLVCATECMCISRPKERYAYRCEDPTGYHHQWCGE